MFLLDEGQNIVKSYRYDAFGEVRKEGGGKENRITYTGQVYDKKAEQYYLRARYYNPKLGRFTQEAVGLKKMHIYMLMQLILIDHGIGLSFPEGLI